MTKSYLISLEELSKLMRYDHGLENFEKDFGESDYQNWLIRQAIEAMRSGKYFEASDRVIASFTLAPYRNNNPTYWASVANNSQVQLWARRAELHESSIPGGGLWRSRKRDPRMSKQSPSGYRARIDQPHTLRARRILVNRPAHSPGTGLTRAKLFLVRHQSKGTIPWLGIDSPGGLRATPT